MPDSLAAELLTPAKNGIINDGKLERTLKPGEELADDALFLNSCSLDASGGFHGPGGLIILVNKQLE